MSKSLHLLIFEDRLDTAICRAVHYVGFPFRELAEKMKPLVAEFGAGKVAQALFNLVEHVGRRTMLRPAGRIAC